MGRERGWGDYSGEQFNLTHLVHRAGLGSVKAT